MVDVAAEAFKLRKSGSKILFQALSNPRQDLSSIDKDVQRVIEGHNITAEGNFHQKQSYPGGKLEDQAHLKGELKHDKKDVHRVPDSHNDEKGILDRQDSSKENALHQKTQK